MYRGVITMAVLRVGEPLGNHPTHEFLQKDFLKSLLDLITHILNDKISIIA